MSTRIGIVGGGVAGLIAAWHCEQAGYTPELFERNSALGGRVQTDIHPEGFRLDHGFQVMLSDYKEVNRYLNIEALECRSFQPGALIFDNKGSFSITDPLRVPRQLFSVLFSRVGSLRDKYLIWRLTRQLAKTSREECFVTPDTSTFQFLKDFGFSQKIIDSFFKPFFGGIFLENSLTTPASMFRFVFKMFGSGDALLPKNGIQAITTQLVGKLQRTIVHLDTAVDRLEGNHLITADGHAHYFDKIILTIDPALLMPNLAGQNVQWQSTTALYFFSDSPVLSSPIIGLVADEDSPINNFSELTQLWPDFAPTGKHLISVTLKETPSKHFDPSIIANEIKQRCQYTGALVFLAQYDIPKALPVLDTLQYTVQATSLSLTDDIYLAGDYLLNGSLDAAMRSGRLAAEALLISLN